MQYNDDGVIQCNDNNKRDDMQCNVIMMIETYNDDREYSNSINLQPTPPSQSISNQNSIKLTTPFVENDLLLLIGRLS